MPTPRPTTIDVWGERGELDVASMALRQQWLSSNEIERMLACKRMEVARAFVSARGFLRHVLSEYAECSPQEIEFGCGEFGKPSIANRVAASVRPEFNLARGKLPYEGKVDVVVAVHESFAIGVDLERASKVANWPESDIISTARTVMTTSEFQQWKMAPLPDRVPLFVRLWTAKEAIMKGCGHGMSCCPDSIRLPDDWLEAETGTAEIGVPNGDGSKWHFRHLSPTSDDLQVTVAMGGNRQVPEPSAWMIRYRELVGD